MEITKVVKPFLRRGWTNTFGNIYIYILPKLLVHPLLMKGLTTLVATYIYIYIYIYKRRAQMQNPLNAVWNFHLKNSNISQAPMCRFSNFTLMNEWIIYIMLLLCIAIHPKCFTIMWGGSLLHHHQCAASTWMMRQLPQHNGASALTTHQLQVERRESHRANSVDGDY